MTNGILYAEWPINLYGFYRYRKLRNSYMGECWFVPFDDIVWC